MINFMIPIQKILVIGEKMSGKSQFILSVKGQEIDDLSNSSSCLSLVISMIKGVFSVYDITNISSFDSCLSIYNDIKTQTDYEKDIFFIGMKMDIADTKLDSQQKNRLYLYINNKLSNLLFIDVLSYKSIDTIRVAIIRSLIQYLGSNDNDTTQEGYEELMRIRQIQKVTEEVFQH
ncbi:hypothetical protein WA158_006370 [Blastocystis sp. Blastoise]